MTKFIEKLEDQKIKYSIETDTNSKCQKISISKADEGQVRATIEYII